jgi:hypothetical protein
MTHLGPQLGIVGRLGQDADQVPDVAGRYDHAVRPVIDVLGRAAEVAHHDRCAARQASATTPLNPSSHSPG